MKRNTQKSVCIGILMCMVSFAPCRLFSQTFEPTLESFKQYQCPEWFRNAKFGIWAYWGPQAVPCQGNSYARKMYQEGSEVYKYHVGHYGHPSKFGYKDIIPLWKAEKWNPNQLMTLYKKTGAKYFVSMGTNQDNFFLWDSEIHKWNSVNMGPKKDIVGLWRQAAKKKGLRFGVSEHLASSYTWFQTSRGADKKGQMAKVPYDGNNPEFEDLYHPKAAPKDKGWLTKDPENQRNWLACISELIDKYHPDLLYSDSELPFGETGRTMLAHFYNGNIVKTKKGDINEAVYSCKLIPSEGRWVQDVEDCVLDSISSFPWQTDTSIGDWFYRTGQEYKSGTQVIQMLVDIVSKNGNLLLNVVQTPEGDLEQDVLHILGEIGKWTTANGEGIYGTRPWKIYGEGPSTIGKKVKGQLGGIKDIREYQSSDIRFTTKGETLYAFCMSSPTEDIKITSLGKNSRVNDKLISSVKMLGSKDKLIWSQQAEALVINKPSKLPEWEVIALEIKFVK